MATPIRQALREWHIGKVIAAYRMHDFHGRALSQEQVAVWLGMTQAQLSRIENGDPVHDLSKLIDWARILEIPPDLLWFKLPFSGDGSMPKGTPPSLGELSQTARNAAADSLRFARAVVASGHSTETLDTLRWEIERIAVDYVHMPLQTVFHDLVATRNTVFALLGKRHPPEQASELYLLAGIVCAMLAQGSHNAGNQRAARAQLRTAWTCAELADHDALRAWIHGTAALIEEWSGNRQQAVELAARGSQFDASRDSLTRLAAIEARAAARVGNLDRVNAALTQLHDSQEKPDRGDAVVNFGGVLSFPDAKQSYYLGSTFGLIGKHDAAQSHAQEAVEAYGSGDPTERSYGDEALARLDIVNARVATGDLDGADDAMAPVVGLPVTLRIRQLDTALKRTRMLLDDPSLADVKKAGEMRELLLNYREEVQGFRRSIPPATANTGPAALD